MCLKAASDIRRQSASDTRSEALDEIDDPDGDVRSNQVISGPDLIGSLSCLDTMLELRSDDVFFRLAGDMSAVLFRQLMSIGDFDNIARSLCCDDRDLAGS